MNPATVSVCLADGAETETRREYRPSLASLSLSLSLSLSFSLSLSLSLSLFYFNCCINNRGKQFTPGLDSIAAATVLSLFPSLLSCFLSFLPLALFFLLNLIKMQDLSRHVRSFVYCTCIGLSESYFTFIASLVCKW